MLKKSQHTQKKNNQKNINNKTTNKIQGYKTYQILKTPFTTPFLKQKHEKIIFKKKRPYIFKRKLVKNWWRGWFRPRNFRTIRKINRRFFKIKRNKHLNNYNYIFKLFKKQKRILKKTTTINLNDFKPKLRKRSINLLKNITKNFLFALTSVKKKKQFLKNLSLKNKSSLAENFNKIYINRLDTTLSMLFNIKNITQSRELIKVGLIRINNNVCKKIDYVLKDNDFVDLSGTKYNIIGWSFIRRRRKSLNTTSLTSAAATAGLFKITQTSAFESKKWRLLNENFYNLLNHYIK